MREITKRFMRADEAAAYCGLAYSTFYAAQPNGLIPRGIRTGRGTVAWPVHELDAINDARMAGWTNDQIRALVVRLEKARARVVPDEVPPQLKTVTVGGWTRAAR